MRSVPVRLAALALPLALALPVRAHAQAPFEGVIQQHVLIASPAAVAKLAGGASVDPAQVVHIPVDKVKALDASELNVQDATLYIKGRKMRVDGQSNPAMGKTYTIIDADKEMVYVVVPANKRVMTMSKEEMKDLGERMEQMRKQMGMQEPEDAADAKVKPLGSKTINGLKTAGYEVDGKSFALVAWVSAELKHSMGQFEEMQADMRAMNRMGTNPQEAIADKGFPLESQVVMKSPPGMAGPQEGYVYVYTQVQKVERKPLDASMFDIPADYTQVPMSKMMGAGPSH